MLVVTRKKGERVLIKLPSGEHIVITMVKAPHQGSRLGIEAPKEFVILREEVAEAPAA